MKPLQGSATLVLAVHVGTGLTVAVAVEHIAKHGVIVALVAHMPNNCWAQSAADFLCKTCVGRSCVLRGDGEPAIKDFTTAV